jgi:hypothetical protein
MAVHNNLFLFAWLCAVILPIVLQVIAGLTGDVRDYLGDLYGVPTLYMLFTMTYGFATVFISYYQASNYRKAGTLDLLRVASFSPGQVLGGVFAQLQVILGPPVLVFCGGLLIYGQFDGTSRGWLRDLTMIEGVFVALLLLLIQAMLSAIPLLGLFRRGEVLALACLPVVLPLNVAPMFITQSRGFSGAITLAALLAALAIVLCGAWFRLSRFWPPHRA